MRESVPKGHDITGCVDRMRAEYTAKWGVQLAGMIFQTRSDIRQIFSYCEKAGLWFGIELSGSSVAQYICF